MLAAMAPDAPARAAAAPAAQVSVGRCYAVGKRVAIHGSGFADTVPFDISVDGVDFGQGLTDATGAFSASLAPGGLGAGQAQITDTLTASDGSSSATARFTVTRLRGALVGAAPGASPRRAVPFEVWDFAPTGPEVEIYLHYVAPDGSATHTVALGRSTGQCGALRSPRRELFPFTPSRGTWTLQFDTSAAYSATPGLRAVRLHIAIS